MNRALSILLLALAAFAPGAVCADVEPSHRFREMAPGVYFASGTGTVTVFSNAMVVVNEDHVVVVDSHVTPDAGRALADSIATLTDKPIRYLVNTHFHFDHAHGNAGFPAEVKVLGHEITGERLRQDVTKEPIFQVAGSAESVAFQVAEAEVALEKAPEAERPAAARQLATLKRHHSAVKALSIRPPDLTFDRRLTLREGGREIQLLFLGRGHTGGDVVVYLPAEKILFTGDLLQPGAPFLGDGYPDEWVLTLGAVAALPFDWVLPGHGEPFQDRAVIETAKRFLLEFTAEVRGLRAEGHDAKAAAARLKLEGWHDYLGAVLSLPAVMELQVQRLYDLDAGAAR
ncbi:MAG: MBL fold metallo-hydrolase [Deltaproteobacteria bacterium]|nr:MBL fold metallo-hydrolase [Deltaproteobacteria bacterium]